ncbi:hypothetical protein J6590_040508 [Homalodisca vitripennis]|nr:hypothetical protein J6590_040508 [Homalodisca vitripennis]
MDVCYQNSVVASELPFEAATGRWTCVTRTVVCSDSHRPMDVYGTLELPLIRERSCESVYSRTRNLIEISVIRESCGKATDIDSCVTLYGDNLARFGPRSPGRIGWFLYVDSNPRTYN